MGKTYRRNTDDAEYYKSIRLQREAEQRRKKQNGKATFDKESNGDNSRRPNKWDR